MGGSGVQRSDDARDDCLIVCPLPNFSIEQWRMMVIIIENVLFVTSQRDVIFTFANQRYAYYPTRTLLTLCTVYHSN